VLVLAGACLFCVLVIGVPRAVPGWPVGDAALTELSTIQAAHGQQLLGAYSRYGWHHPGPFLFYVLVPFYVLGGAGSVSLNAGALAVNLVSLLSVGLVLWKARHHEAAPSFAVALTTLIVGYLLRVPALLTSAWNPHVVVLPFIAFALLAAAVAAGDITLLPLLVVFASFACQGYVGLVPVTGAVTIVVFVTIVVTEASAHNSARRRALTLSLLLSACLLALLWVLPVVEELTETAGNITMIWRFFRDGRSGQPLMTAFRAWSHTLVGVARPEFYLARATELPLAVERWPEALAILEVAALAAVAVEARRVPWRFRSALACMCLLASLVALWSASRIPGTLWDHLVFWVSGLGVINLAVVLSAFFGTAGGWHHPSRPRVSDPRWCAGAAVFLVGTAMVFGLSSLRVARMNTYSPTPEQKIVRELTTQIAGALVQNDIHKPRFSIDGFDWGIAMSVLLQLRKMGVPFAVDASQYWLFGRPLEAKGDEDAALTFCSPRLHEQMSPRQGNFVAAAVGSNFVDGIRLPLKSMVR
jgi:hypothetical protein